MSTSQELSDEFNKLKQTYYVSDDELNKLNIPDDELKKLKLKYEVSDDELKKLKIPDDELKKLKRTYEISDEEIDKLKSLTYKISVDEIFVIPDDELKKLKLPDEEIKKFKRKYEIYEDELKKLKLKYTIPDEEIEKLKQKYELSDGELKKLKQDSKISDLEFTRFKQMYGIVENEFTQLERAREIKRLKQALNEWKKTQYKTYKHSILCLIISSVAFVISISLSISYQNVIKSGITIIISAMYGVGSFGTLIANLITLRDLYAEKALDMSDHKEEEISDDIVKKSLKYHPSTLYPKIDFMEAIKNNVRYLLTWQTTLAIIISVILFIASVITVLSWLYGSVQFQTVNSILIILSIISLYESIGFMISINLIIHSRVKGIKKDIAEKYRNEEDGEIENGVIGKNKKDFLTNLEVTINIMSKEKLLDSDFTELNEEARKKIEIIMYAIKKAEVYFYETISLKHFYPNQGHTRTEKIKLCACLLILMIFSPIPVAFGVVSYNDQRNLEARRISVDDTELYIITCAISGSNTYPLAVQSLIV
ncbi:hypothetical protein C2G38_2154414 [Gigaspora rosea]|uniref:Uncharacterized protein n=1 Tax=Gigaspora rosea TaxID=44941 RepID=A0A397W6R5_9GLOM|nr:hypothetical protein C2G38_2154414 [Gigaspora rosea]CAG8700862.1 24992_t:CDS:1 [Gigaspora rosea]